MLDGGIRTGEVTEIYGESGVGKTQLCMQLAINCMMDPGAGGLYGSSIYIQASPTFPAERLHQLSRYLFHSNFIDEDPLGLVQVKRLDDPEQIFLALNQVESMILNSAEGCRHTRVVVLDSIAYLFRHAHDNTPTGYLNRTRELMVVARKMKQIARSYNLAFLVVNEVADVFDTDHLVRGGVRTYTSGRQVKAALGASWEEMMPNKMFLSKNLFVVEGTPRWCREWTIVKSTNAALHGRSCNFRITHDGFEPDNFDVS